MISTVDIETTYDTNFNPSPFIATNKLISVGINKEYYFFNHYEFTGDASKSFNAVQEILNQWTRRIIALTAVFFIIGWPKLVPVFFDTSVYLTWTEFTRGFLFLIEQKEIVLDKEFFGVVITPLDTHLMSAIIGLYFGGSLVKK